MYEKEIMVACKKCGAQTPANKMIMDLDYKMMVCPNCVKAKKHMEPEHMPQHPGQAQVSLSVSKAQIQASSLPASSKIMKKCTSCGYPYKYNPETATPRNCPFCGKSI